MILNQKTGVQFADGLPDRRRGRYQLYADFVRLRQDERRALGKLLRARDGIAGSGAFYLLRRRGLAEMKGGRYVATAVARKAFAVCSDCHRAIFKQVFKYHTGKCDGIKEPEVKPKPARPPRPCRFCKESIRARCGMCGRKVL